MTDFLSIDHIINYLNESLEDNTTPSSLKKFLKEVLYEEKQNTFNVDIIKKSFFLTELKNEWYKVSKNAKISEERAILFKYNIIIKSLGFYHNSLHFL